MLDRLSECLRVVGSWTSPSFSTATSGAGARDPLEVRRAVGALEHLTPDAILLRQLKAERAEQLRKEHEVARGAERDVQDVSSVVLSYVISA